MVRMSPFSSPALWPDDVAASLLTLQYIFDVFMSCFSIIFNAVKNVATMFKEETFLFVFEFFELTILFSSKEYKI